MTGQLPAIAVFIRTLRDGGGAQRAMVRFASGLARSGHPVTVLTLLPGGAFESELDPAVRQVPLAGGRLARAVPAIAGYLRRERPATLFTTEPACNVIAILAGKLAGVGTRVVIREGLFPSVALKESPYRATRLAYRIAPYVYPRADGIVAIASDMAADLSKVARVPLARIVTIPVNPVVTPDLIEAAGQPPAHPWFSDGGPPVVLGVGRLSRQKDFGSLIRAFARVREKRECRLVIFGEGSERAALEGLVAQSGHAGDIDLPGFMAKPYPYMRNCAVFVLSSRYEGLPNVLIEAVACGAPSVAADCPSGPVDVLDHGRFGPLVPVGDDAAMAQAIEAVLDAPLDRAVLAQRGLDFTVERSLDRYLPVLFPGLAAEAAPAREAA